MNRCIADVCVSLVALGLFGCTKKNASEVGPSASAPTAAASLLVASTTTAPAVASSAPSAAPTETLSDTAPESFAGAAAITNPAATGLGCEAKAKQGWLQILCRKKSGTGGHPKRAVLGTDAGAPEILADEQGELKLVVPWRSGGAQAGIMEWTDAKYTLEVKDTELRIDWVSSLELRRSCAELEKASKAVVASAQKQEAEDHLTAVEAGRLPRFGVCQPAGTGSWAIVLRGLSASEAGDNRVLKFELDVAHVDLEGVVAKHELGSMKAKLGGFELRQLVAFDYDDDGNDELIFPYELKAIAPKTSPAALPMIWTMQSGQVAAYAKAPAPFVGGALVTQLEFDMRPDIGQYGPFVAYLGNDCGIDKCPPRLTGPVLYARSMPDGSFSYGEPSAKTAVDRVCGKVKPILVEQAGAVNPTRTAQNVACARLRGDATDGIVAQLKEKSTLLCKGAQTCPLMDGLIGFAGASFER